MSHRDISEFTLSKTNASKAGLLDLFTTLATYQDAIVLIGGWVPYFLIKSHPRPERSFSHVGSIDVDLLVDPGKASTHDYRSIVEMIEENDWHLLEDGTGRDFRYVKTIQLPEEPPYVIKVDFLAPFPDGPTVKGPHTRVQFDLEAHKLEGAPLALANRERTLVHGVLPNGAIAEEEIPMLNVVGCLGTKGLAINRNSWKDSYDIVSILDNYGPGVGHIANLVRPQVSDPLMGKALDQIARRFHSVQSLGPTDYSDFMLGDEKTQAMNRRRAFELVSDFERFLH